MTEAITMLQAYIAEQHPHAHAELFRLDRLKEGWLAVFDCKPGGVDPVWVPQYRVVYLHEPTARVVFDMIAA